MTPQQLADQFIAICNAGFRNEFEHANWKKKHQKEIDLIPWPLKNDVLIAWEQATSKEFSGRPARGLSRSPNGSDSEAGRPIPDASDSEPIK